MTLCSRVPEVHGFSTQCLLETPDGLQVGPKELAIDYPLHYLSVEVLGTKCFNSKGGRVCLK